MRLLRILSARHLVAVACHQKLLLLLLYLWHVMHSYYCDNNCCCHSNLWLFICLFSCCGIVIVCCLLVVCWLSAHRSVTHCRTHAQLRCGLWLLHVCIHFCYLKISPLDVAATLLLFTCELLCCCLALLLIVLIVSLHYFFASYAKSQNYDDIWQRCSGGAALSPYTSCCHIWCIVFCSCKISTLGTQIYAGGSFQHKKAQHNNNNNNDNNTN